ncbi:MAG: efflux RND transporter periplasmic adaptor subunit [Verrucomicrobiales bacterium]|nr:MAG: efflux RND transporter periplasmic adaptor subunit [Verrucomicrobiota bacterium]|tara:strand:- start:1851 stop:2987 length:1137 start_codon:yes stop_codon:yes gene_type:complete
MKKWAQITAVFIVGLIGILVFYSLVATKPVAETVQRQAVLSTVEVWLAEPTEHQVVIESQGVVEPVHVTDLASEVGGRVKFLSPEFEVGQRFQEGQVILEIDSSDYEAIQAKANSELAEAKLYLIKERALSQQASRDWEALGKGKDPNDLVLRKPQLETALARVVAAKAALEKSERDLERTKIRSPYESKIKNTNIELGSLLSPGTTIGSIYSADKYEIRLPVSISDYDFVEFDFSSEVSFQTDIAGAQYKWTGQLLRTESQVDRSSQSIFLVASIENSELKNKFLVPGIYLKAKLFGKKIKDTYSVPRGALIGKNRIIIALENDTVSFKEVTIIRSSREEVIISEGISKGDRIVTTPIPNAIEGMKVNIYDESVLVD